jgi:hypothetical protein
MELPVQIFGFILLIHFLADFALQTHEQASKKSSSLVHLHQHVMTYSLTWLFAIWIWTSNIESALVFWVITYAAHFATDFVTSRAAKTYFDQQDYHNGFVVVGADQVLHYIQLVLTFILINNL